jgi:hypothetical protein
MVNIFRRRVGRAARLGALALLIAAPCASAAERFASPAGTGTACTQPAPCDVITAVNSATSGDDITIEPGTYGSPTPLALTLDDEGKTLSIHGRDGEPRPVIISQAGYGIELLGMSSARNLDIEDATGQYGIYVSGAYSSAIDHVISHVSAAGAIACYPAGTLTDSVCWSSGSSGVATTLLVPASVTATLRNDTLIASGSGGTAVAANPTSGGTMTINLSNSIARGAGSDISASTDAEPNTTAIVNADHSNYATVQTKPGGGGSTITVTPAGSATNQTGAPAFVNAAAGDFRELPGSLATIDRGVDSLLNGTTDLEGAPRRLGASTDIGAYEFVPPPTCSPLGASTAEGRAATLQLACTDAVGAALTYAIVGGPAHGTLSLTAATGQVIYAPSPGYSGSDSFTYRASSSHGTAAAAPVSITVSPTPILVTPIIGALGERSKVWREGGALARISANSKRKKKPPVGTIFSFSLNVPASVTFAFTQQLAGRKVNGKCVAQTNKNRRKRVCKRTVTRGTLSFTGHAGTNKVSFQGRLSRAKKLAPGTYTFVIIATTATGRRSQPKSLSFTIVK